MRVLLLGFRGICGPQGGVEAHVETIARELAALNGSTLSLEVVERQPYVQRPPAEEAALPIGVRRRPIWSPTSAPFEALVHTLLGVLYAGVRRPDVLHIHGIGPGLMAPLARLLGLTVVVTHHGEDYLREKWGWLARAVLRLGEQCAVRFAHTCIVVNPVVRQRLERRYDTGLCYIPNAAVRLGRESAAASSPRAAASRRLIISVGRIVPEKRQLDLIEAFSRIDAPGWRLVLVGGADHQSDYARSVSAAASKRPEVVMTGAIDKRAVADHLAQAGLFVLPSSHEGLPIALLEAMGMGLPVIVSDIPNLKALSLPDNCYLPVGDTERLSTALQKFVDTHPDGGGGVDWTAHLAPFDVEAVARATHDVYLAAANRRRRAGRRPNLGVGVAAEEH